MKFAPIAFTSSISVRISASGCAAANPAWSMWRCVPLQQQPLAIQFEGPMFHKLRVPDAEPFLDGALAERRGQCYVARVEIGMRGRPKRRRIDAHDAISASSLPRRQHFSCAAIGLPPASAISTGTFALPAKFTGLYRRAFTLTLAAAPVSKWAQYEPTPAKRRAHTPDERAGKGRHRG